MSSRPEGVAGSLRWPARVAVAFGRFWWDFLVGDTPELFLGTLAVLGLVALLVRSGSPQAVVVAALPLLVALLLVATLARAARQRRR
jgi:hypothetical protein